MSMMTSDTPRVTSSLRFRTDAPHPDESLSSALDRTASLWGVSRWEILRHIGYKFGTEKELDGALPEPFLRSMAQAFNMDPADLASRAVPKSRLRVLLAPRLRHAYCPLCFEGDWLSGITPYFRRDWGRFWVTHCRVHAAPLSEWVAVNGFGDRRLPHAYYLSHDASASLPTWMAVNLQEARRWQSSVVQHGEGHDLWRALMKMEEAWWRAGIGDLGISPEYTVLDGEKVLIRLAALFLATRNAGEPCMAEVLHIPTHQHHVLGYDRRRQGREIHDGSFERIRWQFPSIQARRTVLILVAHTLGKLNIDLRYETGAKLPRGHSREWLLHILNHQSDLNVAHVSLRRLENWKASCL